MTVKAGERNLVCFMSTQAVLLILAFALTNKTYEYGPVPSFVVALIISWIPMQLIGRAMERRWLWPPSSQFASFFWGDSVFLPGAAALIGLAFQRLPDGSYWFQSRTWLIACAFAGIIVGVVFRASERQYYSRAQFYSPTKLIHDFLAVPAFVYYLLSGAPALFYTQDMLGVVNALVAFFLFCVWVFFVLSGDEGRHISAHIDYDWERMRPI